MRRNLLVGSIALALAAVPVAASAARAYAVGGAPIYAGPGNDYPVVAQLGRGVAVNVNGCLSDYSWCDINFGPNRGWVYAGDLTSPYHNRRVPILEYGPRLAVPTITFSIGSYWDRYYRGRPFYGERSRWEERSHANAHRDDRRGYDARDEHRGDRVRSNDEHGRDFRGNEARGRDEGRSNDRGDRGDRERDRGRD